MPGTYPTIQAAINAAPDGATITVQAGTYYEALFIGNSAKSLTIRSVAGAASTIVDAAGKGAAAINVFYASGEIVIEGLTFRNGAPPQAAGGGFVINASSPAFVNCIFESNAATDGGGGVLIGSNATFAGCIIRNNSARHFGGGVYITGGSQPVFTSCDIVGNASGTGGAGVANNGAGGGVLSVDSSPTFRGGRISSNRSKFAAGGVFQFGSYGRAAAVMVIEDAEIADNVSTQFSTADNPSEGGGMHIEDNAIARLTRVRVLRNSANTGGGLNMYRGRYELVDVAIEDNQAVAADSAPSSTGWGGGIAAQANYSGQQQRPGSEIVMTRTSVRGNSALTTGGGLAVFGDNFSAVRSTVVVQDSVITENQSRSQGGGALFNRAIASFSNSIVSRNSVAGGTIPFGGGIMAIVNSTLTLTNTTVAGNTAGQYGGGVFVNEGTALTMTGSRIYDNDAGTDGGGGLFVGAATGSGTIRNSVIADNGQFQIVEHMTPCPALTYQNNSITPRTGNTDLYAGTCGRPTTIAAFNAQSSGRASGNNSTAPSFAHFLAAPAAGVHFRLAWSVARTAQVTVDGVGTFGRTASTLVSAAASTSYTLRSGGTAVGSVPVAVVNAPSAPPRRRATGDFDGDGRTDMGVYRPSNGTWYLVYSSTGGQSNTVWGNSSDWPVPADYDGDGKTDVAVFRPSNGTWFIQFSSTGTAGAVQWGNASDWPMPADYDGDGKADIAVFRPTANTWFLRFSSTGNSGAVVWGASSDIPAAGDYDGDGKAEVAVYRPSTGTWYLRFSTTGAAGAVQWGNAADIPVPGDYDGDGATDVAVYRPSTGRWYLRYSSGGSAAPAWGNSSDRPVVGDFDGDGRADLTVFRPSDGVWYFSLSSGPTPSAQWGNGADVPILKRP